MLAIAIVAGSFTGPGQTIGVSVFINSFIADLSLSRDSVALAYLVGTLLGATAMPKVGQLIDEFGIKRSQMIIAGLFGVALLNMSLVQNWMWLAIGFMFIRMLGQGSLTMVSTVTVALWFDQLRGRAMGLLGIGVSAGIALTPVVMNASITQLGWRQAWVAAAVTVPLVLLPITFFGLVDRPAVIGQLPDGQLSRRHLERHPEPAAGNTWGYTRGEAIRHPAFWLLLTMVTMTSMLITGLNFHQIDLLVQSGLTEGEAALMFLPQILGSTLSGFAVGWLVDRVAGRFLPALGLVLLGLSHLLASTLGAPWVVVVYALSLGVTGGATRVISSSLLPKWFGTAHIGSLQGVIQFTGVAGSSLGPLLLSVSHGQLGSYGSAALLLAVLPFLTAGYALVVRPPGKQNGSHRLLSQSID
ncbi:MAG: MFS transporter [Acidimicrobiales bacterium]|nr:MFS transporter [Acidimicrobiales bacterium]